MGLWFAICLSAFFAVAQTLARSDATGEIDFRWMIPREPDCGTSRNPFERFELRHKSITEVERWVGDMRPSHSMTALGTSRFLEEGDFEPIAETRFSGTTSIAIPIAHETRIVSTKMA